MELTVAKAPMIDVASSSSSEYCTGYPFTFVSATIFDILTFDVVNQYYVGRRLKFLDGAATYYGIIASSVFASSKTTITMTMESGANLTATISDTCFSSGVAGWSPIVADPFVGDHITRVLSGTIGVNVFWIAVTLTGKVASSIDRGLTWTLATSPTTQPLRDIAYNPTEQSFVICGDDDHILHSTDGLTWTNHTIGTETGIHVYSVLWSIEDSVWLFLTEYPSSAPNRKIVFSSDLISFTLNAATLSNSSHRIKHKYNLSASDWHTLRVQYLYRYSTPSDTVGSSTLVTNATHTVMDFIEYNTTYGDMIAVAKNAVAGTGYITKSNSLGQGAVISNALTTPLNSCTVNPAIRMVVVGDAGYIGYINAANFTTDLAIVNVSNGFDVLTNINAVHYDANDGLFIAVASNGQICRSTNGIS